MTQSSSRLEVTLPTETVVAMTRVFDAPRQLVFDAFTKPEHVSKWMGQPPKGAQNPLLSGWTMPVCEIDLRHGGAWRYVLEGPGGEKMTMRGVYQEIQPPERIVNTETFDEYAEMGSAVVTTTFEERDGKTVVTVWADYGSRETRDAVVQTGMEEGAGESYDRLAEYLTEIQA